MEKQRVVITGLGVVAPNAVGLEAFREALWEGKSGIRHLTELEALNFACQVGGVPPLEEEQLQNYLPGVILRSLRSTGVKYAAVAGVDAWLDAGLQKPESVEQEPDWETGCIFGSGMTGAEPLRYGIGLVDAGKVKRIGGRLVEQGMASGPSAFLGGLLALGNQVSSNASACATGTEAILIGLDRIRSGKASRMLVGSCDSMGPYVWGGFDSMRVLNRRANGEPEKASRPLSATAKGFVPGAGAGALVLETLASALDRGARIYAEVLGGAVNSGGHRAGGSMTAPNSQGVKRCIQTAISDAGIRPGEIDAISGHLTATNWDPEEIANWSQALGRKGKDFPYVHAPKSLIGHCLSASGSIESVASVLQLHHDFFHASANCEDLHPDIAPWLSADKVPQKRMDQPGFAVVAKSGFGFGDVNAVTIFRRWS
jgi:3-oxoacyl-[acyl-carrier-protein] synthase-1